MRPRPINALAKMARLAGSGISASELTRIENTVPDSPVIVTLPVAGSAISLSDVKSMRIGETDDMSPILPSGSLKLIVIRGMSKLPVSLP